MKVIVNGREVEWGEQSMSYADLCVLAGLDPKRVYSATYRSDNGSGTKFHGSLIPGGELSNELHEGTIFNIYNTSNS